jgi:hypothetical protein
MRSYSYLATSSLSQNTFSISLVSLLWFGFVVFLPATAQETLKSLDKNRSHDVQSIAEMRKNLKAFLKNSKRDAEPEVKQAAIRNLCQLHRSVVRDPRFSGSEALRGIQVTLSTRLSTVLKDLEISQKRLARAEQKSADKGRRYPASTGARFGESSPSLNDALDRHELEKSLQYAYRLANDTDHSFQGGSGQFESYLTGNFGPHADNAEVLISLIQSTINPRYWRLNGGPGSMRFYEPGLVLVITASQEMHDRIQALLLQLK